MLPPTGSERPATPRSSGRQRFADINGFVDNTMSTFTRSEIAVWLVLWRDTKPDGLVRTSQKDIGRRAGASDRAVRTALRKLIGAGLVKVTRKGRLGAGPSAYRVRGVNPRGP
jgi:hypothetical protein